MSNVRLRTQAQIEKAIIEAHGTIVTAAAKLKISRGTLYNWLNGKGRDDLDLKALNELVHQEREGLLDHVETALIKNALKGDASSQQFIMRARGASRGYTFKTGVEVSGPGGSPVKVEHIGADAINEIARSIYGTPED